MVKLQTQFLDNEDYDWDFEMFWYFLQQCVFRYQYRSRYM